MGRPFEEDRDFFLAGLAGGAALAQLTRERSLTPWAFEKVGSEVVYQGKIATVRVERFRHDDGEVVEREMIEHPGAAVMLPLDGDRIWLVRQPREVVGEELLELPAGKLNGGEVLDTAKRELREEIGKSAANWQHLIFLLREPRLHRTRRSTRSSRPT